MKETKIKKIFIILPHLAKGGGERVASNLMDCLSNKYQLHLLLYRNEISYSYKGNLHILGNDDNNKDISLKKFINLFNKYRFIKKLKNMYYPTHSISFFQGTNILNVLTKREKNEKVILTVHTNISNNRDFIGIYGLLHRYAIKLLYNKADFIIVPSYGIKNMLINTYKVKENKVKVIYNPIDINKIRVEARKSIGYYEKIFSKRKVIINVGRLTEAKGQKYLIKVYSYLKKRHKNIKLVLLGDGELREYLYNFSLKLGLKTFAFWKKAKVEDKYDIYFLGYHKNPYPYIKRSTVLVSTSLWEGFSNVIIEALSLGIPVVSTDCKYGPREIILPNNNYNNIVNRMTFGKYGILTPPIKISNNKNNHLTNEEIELAKAIDSVITFNNPYIMNIKINSQKRAKHFDLENFCKSWVKLLNKLENEDT